MVPKIKKWTILDLCKVLSVSDSKLYTNFDFFWKRIKYCSREHIDLQSQEIYVEILFLKIWDLNGASGVQVGNNEQVIVWIFWNKKMHQSDDFTKIFYHGVLRFIKNSSNFNLKYLIS